MRQGGSCPGPHARLLEQQYNSPAPPLADGGECGVPYETLFVNPSTDHQTQWFSVDVGPVHFLQLSSGEL